MGIYCMYKKSNCNRNESKTGIYCMYKKSKINYCMYKKSVNLIFVCTEIRIIIVCTKNQKGYLLYVQKIKM